MHLPLDKMHDEVSRFHVVSMCHSDFGFQCIFFFPLCCQGDGSTRRASQTPSVSFEQGVPWQKSNAARSNQLDIYKKQICKDNVGRNRRQKRRLFFRFRHVFRHWSTCLEKRYCFAFLSRQIQTEMSEAKSSCDMLRKTKPALPRDFVHVPF